MRRCVGINEQPVFLGGRPACTFQYPYIADARMQLTPGDSLYLWVDKKDTRDVRYGFTITAVTHGRVRGVPAFQYCAA